VTINAVRIDGLKVTRRDVAERALGRLGGQPYDPAVARGAAARLAQLGVFSRAEFTGLEGGAQWQNGTLAYKVEEPRYNRFEGAAGVQSDGNLVGLANLELGNLLGTARATALGWQSRGPGRSDFRARYTEPFVLGLPFRFEATLHQELQDSTFTRTRWGARLGYALGTGDRIDVGLEEEHVVQPRGAVSNADLQNTVFAYERDGRDDLVSPRRGTRVRTTGTGVFKRETLRPTRPGEGAETQRSNAGIADLRAETHRRVRASTGLALELWGSGRFSSQRVFADYERTPVGGAATLRGHDEEEFRVDRVALSRLEYRWFPSATGERVSLFWDHALHVHARGRHRFRRQHDRRPRRDRERGRHRRGPAAARRGRAGGRGLRRGARPRLPRWPHPPAARERVLMGLVERVERAFLAGGALARAWPRWEERPGQRAFAMEVAATLERGGVLLAEAPTGVGKSLAYLLPAVLHAVEHGERVVVATCTRSLQDQLHERDVPAPARRPGHRSAVRGAQGEAELPLPARTRAGVAREDDAHDAEAPANVFAPAHEPRASAGTSLEHELLESLREWAARDPSGDLDRFDAFDGDAFRRLRTRVATDPAACTAATCRRGRECFWLRARRRAAEARLVIVKPRAARSRRGARTGLLPPYDVLIVDESHRLEGRPQLAARACGLAPPDRGAAAAHRHVLRRPPRHGAARARACIRAAAARRPPGARAAARRVGAGWTRAPRPRARTRTRCSRGSPWPRARAMAATPPRAPPRHGGAARRDPPAARGGARARARIRGRPAAGGDGRAAHAGRRRRPGRGGRRVDRRAGDGQRALDGRARRPRGARRCGRPRLGLLALAGRASRAWPSSTARRCGWASTRAGWSRTARGRRC
jgi:hypothetical protein